MNSNSIVNSPKSELSNQLWFWSLIIESSGSIGMHSHFPLFPKLNGLKTSKKYFVLKFLNPFFLFCSVFTVFQFERQKIHFSRNYIHFEIEDKKRFFAIIHDKNIMWFSDILSYAVSRLFPIRRKRYTYLTINFGQKSITKAVFLQTFVFKTESRNKVWIQF